ncbi:MAG TPA: CHASE4 domain-containing protein, partial [Steroidobacteraceae bacterium]|nr:CHASE4 domain-containing protein [Steroidobacteraceae bacterium]
MSTPRSLRHTVIATLLIGFALLTGVQYFVTSRFVADRVRGIEAIDGFAKLKRLYYALDQLRDELARTNADWAVWDDAYEFARGENPSFVEDNLPIETFQRLQLNAIIIVDNQSRVLFAKMLEPQGRTLVDPTPELIAAARSTAFPERTGFVASTYGPMLVSTRRIQDSSERQFSDARMLMGRTLEDLAPIISRVTAVPMSVEAASAIEIAKNATDESSTIVNGRNTLVLAADFAHAYTPIDDVWGQPLAFLHAQF